ncbi:MAG TPA: sulfatase, partial [Vicinamibacterales bacterium]|nr:sulfatase [Vicinamibacterales bacterium]
MIQEKIQLRSARLTQAELWWMALGFGLAFGALEALETAALRHVAHVQSMTRTSLDVLWVAPLFNVLLNLIVAAGISLVMRVGVPMRRLWAAVIFASIGALGVTLYSGFIGHVAGVLLAIGVGIQVGRVAEWPGFRPWLTRATVIVAAGAVLSFAGLRAREAWIARQVESRVMPGDGTRPNVLLLVLDTVRGDYLSSNGFPRPTTPALDQFAASGVQFAHAYSASSWTLPSHASLLTGLPVTGHGATSAWHNLGADKRQLQQAFQAQGYATGAFVANKVFLLPEWGFGKGFDRFDVYDTRTLLARTTLGRSLRTGLRIFDVGLDPFRPASVINARLERWIDSLAGRPFFALVNYMEAHEPYGQPDVRPPLPTWDKGSARTPAENAILKSAYEREIQRLDTQLGTLFERMSHRPAWANTVVVVVADHGETISDNSFDHGLDLTWEQIQVPLIVRFPGAVPAGLRVATPVSTNDVAATIQELVHAPASGRLPGASLSRYWTGTGDGPAAGESPGILTELIQPGTQEFFRSIVLDDLQYIVNLDTSVERLFHFRDD